MTYKYIYIASAVTIFLNLTACSQSSNVRRYINNDIPNSELSLASPITVQASSIKARTYRAAPSLFSLSNQGQQALIEKLAESNPEFGPRSLARALATEISTNEPVKTDYTSFNRRIFVTIDNQELFATRPADRIDNVRTTIEISNDNGQKDTLDAEFTSWSALANEERTVDIGDLKFSSSSGIGSDIKGSAAVVGNLSAGLEKELTETVNLTASQVRLFGGVNGNKAFIVERGAPLVDVGGFRAIDVTVQVAKQKVRPLVITRYLPQISGTPFFSIASFTLPDPSEACNGVDATVSVKGTIRRVVQGHSTWYEGDDKIELQTFNEEVRIALLPEDDLQTRLFKIQNSIDKSTLLLTPELDLTPGDEMTFNSYEIAENFLKDARSKNNIAFPGFKLQSTGSITNQSWFQQATIEASNKGCSK